MNMIVSTGRRKVASAGVFMSLSGSGKIIVNNMPIGEYFGGNANWLSEAIAPLVALDVLNKYDFKVNCKGGGKSGQAGAIKLGIARALTSHELTTLKSELGVDEVDLNLRLVHKKLKKLGYLTRNSKMVLRKLVGRVKARKDKQFSKR